MIPVTTGLTCHYNHDQNRNTNSSPIVPTRFDSLSNQGIQSVLHLDPINHCDETNGSLNCWNLKANIWQTNHEVWSDHLTWTHIPVPNDNAAATIRIIRVVSWQASQTKNCTGDTTTKQHVHQLDLKAWSSTEVMLTHILATETTPFVVHACSEKY